MKEKWEVELEIYRFLYRNSKEFQDVVKTSINAMKAKSMVQKKLRASYISSRQNSVIDKLTNDLNSPDSPLKLRSLMKSTKSKAKGKLFYSKYECKF